MIQSLNHVTLPLAVFLDLFDRRLDRREIEFHGVAALAADLVTELEALDLRRTANDLAIVVAATARLHRRRNDFLRVLVAGFFVIHVLDDVLHDAVLSRIGVLFSDVATDSSQRGILAAFCPSAS
jgi:hypothetical protein